MNEIKLKVNFTKRTIQKSGVALTTGDYNSTKLIFDFDREDGLKVFEMKNPNNELVLLSNIENNELILVGHDEDANVSLFTMPGNYIFEISLYDGDSKLTSASGKLVVKAEAVLIDSEIYEPYTPIFENLINQVQNLDLDAERVSDGVEVTIIKKDGTEITRKINDGAKGDKGDTGEKGIDGQNGRDGYVQYTAGEHVNIENDEINVDLTDYATKIYVDDDINKLQDEVDNIVSKATATTQNANDILTIEDALEYKTFNKVVDGNIKQETTTGKQLFNANNIVNTNIHILDNGASIVMPLSTSGNGYTSTSAKLKDLCPNLQVDDVCKLTFTRNLGRSYNLQIFIETAGVTWNEGQTKTITQAMLDNNVVLYGNRFGDGETGQCIIQNFTITKDTTHTYNDFEPYTGGQPSPNPDYPQDIEVIEDSVDIKITGKNLCKNPINATDTTSDTDLLIENGVYKLSGVSNSYFDMNIGQRSGNWQKNYADVNDYHLTSNGGNYILKMDFIRNGNVSTGNNFLDIHTNKRRKTTNFIAQNSVTNSITLDNDEYIKSIYIWINGVATTIDCEFTLQLEKGSTSTIYEEYKSHTTTIDLQDNFLAKIGDIKDKLIIDKLGNVSLLKNVGKVVLDGSESGWTSAYISTDLENYFTGEIVNASFLEIYGSRNEYRPIICDYLLNTNDRRIARDAIFNWHSDSRDTHYFDIRLNKSIANDLISFKNWLATNTPTVYYALATPQTINLGNVGIIKTFKGVNNIELIANLDTSFSIEYAQDLQKKIQELTNAIVSLGGNI